MPDIIIDAATNISIREMSGRSGMDSADNNTAQRRWLVRGNVDPVACRVVLLQYAGTIGLYTYDGLGLKNMEWSLYPDGGPAAWEFIANYDYTPEVGGCTISIDTTGATVNTQSAFSQTSFAASGETAPDFGESINVDADGNPQGVSKIIPSLKITVKAKIAAAYVTSPCAYAQILYECTGKVNDAAFLCFAAGEVLFLGATGDLVSEDPVLNFAFEVSPNVTNYSIGGITGINKNGHDYIWFNFKQKQDASSGLKVSTPRAAYVSEVYEEADFSTMKICEPPPPTP
jgi:hypothetical protein